MSDFREVTLPSGAILKVKAAPFADAKALFQAFVEEVRNIQIFRIADLPILLKDALASGFSSPKIEACLIKCLNRCLYNDERIKLDIFEPVKAREDYIAVCAEVARENVAPFMKNLWGLWKDFSGVAEAWANDQSSQSEKTT